MRNEEATPQARAQVRAFVDNWCIRAPDRQPTQNRLYYGYKLWHQRYGYGARLSHAELNATLRAAGYTTQAGRWLDVAVRVIPFAECFK